MHPSVLPVRVKDEFDADGVQPFGKRINDAGLLQYRRRS